MLKPDSDNIIFFDAEFTNLNPREGELISVGMVKFTGEEFYVEIEAKGQASKWTTSHVLPLMTEPKISRVEAAARIREFIGPGRPYMVAYVNQFDTVFLYRLLNIEDASLDWTSAEGSPFHWIPLDFASILFALGRDPLTYNRRAKNNIYRELGIDPAPYREHHALDDAKLLREVYLQMIAGSEDCACGGTCKGKC